MALVQIDEGELRRLRLRVVELEEELAAWRDLEGGGEEDGELAWRRLCRLREYLRANVPPAHVRLLAVLVERKGRIVSRDCLLDRGAKGEECRPAQVGVHVCNIRKAIRAAGRPVSFEIETIWGHGFRLSVEDAATVLAIWGEA